MLPFYSSEHLSFLPLEDVRELRVAHDFDRRRLDELVPVLLEGARGRLDLLFGDFQSGFTEGDLTGLQDPHAFADQLDDALTDGATDRDAHCFGCALLFLGSVQLSTELCRDDAVANGRDTLGNGLAHCGTTVPGV